MIGSEKLLKALLDGTDVSNYECKSRLEHYLKKCCMCEVCDDLEPRTRTEYLLKELSIKMNEGGGSVLIEYGASGTTVPNTGTVEKVYLNTDLSDLEVEALLSQLNYGEFGDYGVLGTDIKSLGLLVMNGMYAIVYISMDTQDIKTFWCNEAFFNQMGSAFGLTHSGWQEFTNPIEINAEVDSRGGLQNDLLTNLFSITPFEKANKTLSGTYDGSDITVTENGSVDVSSLIDEQKIPLSINVEVFSTINNDKVLTEQNYDGTAVTVTENGSVDISALIDKKKIPLNINVDIPDVKVDDKVLVGNYDGTSIDVSENGAVNISDLLDEQKLPLNINVEVFPTINNDKVLTEQNYDGTSITVTKNGSVDISALIDEKKIPLNINVAIPSDVTVDDKVLAGTYDGTSIEVTNTTINISELLDEQKLPLSIEVKDVVTNATITAILNKDY